jgi:hypothetical protein
LDNTDIDDRISINRQHSSGQHVDCNIQVSLLLFYDNMIMFQQYFQRNKCHVTTGDIVSLL